MRLIFMGTPDFAVLPLEKIISKGYDVISVYCQPDKPQGRHMVLTPPPVKVLAQEHNIPVYQPVTLKVEEEQLKIKEQNPDVIVVAAYGKLLPKAVLDTPKYGCINIHGSLLPKYRGAAPIQRAVMNNEKQSGITIMQMGVGMDTGDILMQKAIDIGKDETAGELFDRLSVVGSDLIIEALENIDNLKAVPQDESLATNSPMLSKTDGILDLSKPAELVYAQIRGVSPWPGATTTYRDKNIKIIKAELSDKGDMLIPCGDGHNISVITVQPEGKKAMPSADFLRGLH